MLNGAATRFLLVCCCWLLLPLPGGLCARTPPCPRPPGQNALLARLGALAWHRAGWRGQGVKVAILDSGFRGYRAHLGGVLPGQVLARSFRADRDLEAQASEHGLHCAALVHAIAPDAQLLFAGWEPNDPASFLRAARWARRQGARVLTCSVIMPTWSDGAGGGDLHRDLAALLSEGGQSGGALLFACAGNTALRSWEGVCRGAPGQEHQWLAGCKDNVLCPWSDRVSVEARWQGGSRLAVAVRDLQSGQEVGTAQGCRARGYSWASLRFTPEPGRTYAARLKILDGEGARVRLAVLGADLRLVTPGAGLCFPADGRAVVAVGAVGADGRRQPYSAWRSGGPHPRPELVACVPVPAALEPGRFGGTSACAPQAAALAALLWSSRPHWNASRLRRELTRAATPPGDSPEGCGHGLVGLPPCHLSGSRAALPPHLFFDLRNLNFSNCLENVGGLR